MEVVLERLVGRETAGMGTLVPSHWVEEAFAPGEVKSSEVLGKARRRMYNRRELTALCFEVKGEMRLRIRMRRGCLCSATAQVTQVVR